MSEQPTHEELMRYLDGEVDPRERRRIERALETSTELKRELVIFGKMKEDLQRLSFAEGGRRSIWYTVHRRLTRPIGWILLIAGFALWTGYGSYLYLVSAIDPVEKIATAGITLGLLFLLSSVVYERYREWLTDPYRDIMR